MLFFKHEKNAMTNRARINPSRENKFLILLIFSISLADGAWSFSSNLWDSLRCFKDISYSRNESQIMRVKMATARKNNKVFFGVLSEKKL